MKKRSFIKITSKGYGKRWLNTRIHYIGKRPKLIQDDGRFTSGKNILEALSAQFKKFELIICDSKSKILKKGKVFEIYLSLYELRQMNSALISRKKDVTQRAIGNTFSILFPKYFKEGSRLFSYEDDLFAGILTGHFMPTRLSKQDRAALANFIPKFIASGIAKSSASNKLKAGIELKILQQLAKDLEGRIQKDKSEGAWQDYLKQNILYIQQGYIELIPKANISIVGTSYPDFLLVTHDGYLDILEIKTPFTQLLLEDKSHKNYYWSGEIAKAIAQIENYIQAIVEVGDTVKNKVKDTFGIDLRVIKPRGIIFAGNSNQFYGKKLIQDDFRLLNQGLKNVTVVPYDELLIRLQNYITVLSGINKKRVVAKL